MNLIRMKNYIFACPKNNKPVNCWKNTEKEVEGNLEKKCWRKFYGMTLYMLQVVSYCPSV